MSTPQGALRPSPSSICGEVEHGDSTGRGGVIRGDACNVDDRWQRHRTREFHNHASPPKAARSRWQPLWVNLPGKDKVDRPAIKHRQRQIPAVELPEGAGHTAVIAGEYEGAKGLANTFRRWMSGTCA